MHRFTFEVTDNRLRPIVVQCSCGYATVADTDRMADDRATAHRHAAKQREQLARRADIWRVQHGG